MTVRARLLRAPGAGTLVGGLIGGAASAMGADKLVRSGAIRATRNLINSRPRVRFGGNFKDTQPAYTMRAKAETELSGSLLNARRYLGKEAQLMHG